MAKNVKKAKPAAKPASKQPAKPLKKQAKATEAKPQRGGAERPAPKKPVVKAAPAKTAKANGKKEELAANGKGKKPAVLSAKGKAGKPSKESKKGKHEAEFEDDLMVSDEDLGAEEIPDLSEFDEEEEATPEAESSDEATVAAAAPAPADDEAVLTDAEGRPYCKVKDCDQIAAVDGYCRYHYLLLWKKIQVRRKILADGKLERYVEELTSRYPDKFLEMIRRDLRTEKDFLSAIAELEIDESGLDNEFEDDSQVLDEVRGFGSESSISDEEEF
jgi:hypothetical protein